MEAADKLRSLYIDIPSWDKSVEVDDFLVAIGKKQSNSVYHVAKVKTIEQKNRIKRCYMKVFKSDLITALKRDNDQALITLTWYKR